eukprot:TRINITY_DN451_c0_g1_i1.p2 TRINITY_DN451_c0_g1~~TRINITY_DN451_c0_g1_i1.p2  ORF type:complete len:176 (-),score=64.99 TRINITY_DN451_c0_g1_i1:336-863(-)
MRLLVVVLAVLVAVCAAEDFTDVLLRTEQFTRSTRSALDTEDICFACAPRAATLRQDTANFLAVPLDEVDIPLYQRLGADGEGYTAMLRIYTTSTRGSDALAEVLVEGVQDETAEGAQLSLAVYANVDGELPSSGLSPVEESDDTIDLFSSSSSAVRSAVPAAALVCIAAALLLA